MRKIKTKTILYVLISNNYIIVATKAGIKEVIAGSTENMDVDKYEKVTLIEYAKNMELFKEMLKTYNDIQAD